MTTGQSYRCDRCGVTTDPDESAGGFQHSTLDVFLRPPEGWTIFIIAQGDNGTVVDGTKGHLCTGCTAVFKGVLETGDRVVHNYVP